MTITTIPTIKLAMARRFCVFGERWTDEREGVCLENGFVSMVVDLSTAGSGSFGGVAMEDELIVAGVGCAFGIGEGADLIGGTATGRCALFIFFCRRFVL